MPSAFILTVRSYPAVPLARQLAHQRYVPPNPLVLGRKPLKLPAPAADRDRPVSRRSEPSSRTAFIGEQPNPWELLHPQDAMSRHRGAKPPRRYERSEEISLLSPEYLLSVERRSFRLAAGKSHLHDYYSFTESLVETVVQSLRHSCRSELTRQGISLP